MVCDKVKMCVKDGVWKCERWCVTRLYVKDGVWQCVWEIVSERWCAKDGVCVRDCVWKMVCERWCVCVWQCCVWKMVCDKVVCERWCVTMCERRSRRRRRRTRRRDTEPKTRTPQKDVGEKRATTIYQKKAIILGVAPSAKKNILRKGCAIYRRYVMIFWRNLWSPKCII